MRPRFHHTLIVFSGFVVMFGLAFALRAQKNQAPYDSYEVSNGLTTFHVQGEVSMISGAGANVVVQNGDKFVYSTDRGIKVVERSPLVK